MSIRTRRLLGSLSWLALSLTPMLLASRKPEPGLALTGHGITLRAKASARGFGVVDVTAADGMSGIHLEDIFAVFFKDGSSVRSSSLPVVAAPVIEPVAAEPTALVAAERIAGQQLCADFSEPTSGATFHWCAVLRSGGTYFREVLTIQAGAHDLPIEEVRLLEFEDPGVHVVGTVKGSPMVDGGLFFGVEHPLSNSSVGDNHAIAGIHRVLPLRAGQSVTYSAVIGSAAQDQMRRAFLAYIEAERPRAYAPFLHYNSWFDLGFGNDYDEAGALDRVHAFGEELAVKRHVRLDSFLFDDGWDNPNSLWDFNKGFPQGFTQVAQAAKQYQAGIGVWFSPWGGYWKKKEQRVAFGSANGYEVVHGGFALSGTRYYAAFQSRCLEMIRDFGVNQFKFDGTGNADSVVAGSVFDSDFDAAIHLIRALRVTKPDLFINLTTGTYPSPFWLRYADSIWRGGEDSDFAGVGSKRQQWITYRDADTYKHIVQAGPLFPLNSLMLHGLIYASKAPDLATDPRHDFADEVESYFGSGTQLQEMYITPSLLRQEDWDLLAQAANWSRARSAILKDVHWIGGDPGQLAVYGWASWSPVGWVVTLRNPSDHPQTYQLILNDALELPLGVKWRSSIHYPFADSAQVKSEMLPGKSAPDAPIVLTLAPFEVVTMESVEGEK